jgi:hypothetical protein
MEAEFKAGGYEHALIKRFNDTASIYLKAAWSAAYSQTSATGIIYTYVPLTARLYSEKSKRWINAYEEPGMERVILCRRINGNLHSRKATKPKHFFAN